MRAVVIESFGGPENLAMRELPIPDPGADEVLVRVLACGVCGHDILSRKGFVHDKLEVPLGHEIAGEVVALGEDVTEFKVGQRVATRQRRACHHCEQCEAGRTTVCMTSEEYGEDRPGGYAEYVTLDISGIAAVPDGVTDEAAAIAACAIGTCVRALNLTAASAGERVLVTGASGGLGIHALQIARARGCEAVASTTSPEKVETLSRFADQVVVAPDGRFSEELRERDLQPHIVVDLTSGYTLEQSLRSVRRGGRVAIVGNLAPDPVEIRPGAFIMRELMMAGCNGATLPDLTEALELLASGAVEAQVGGSFSLDQADQAHVAVESGAVRGRVVIRPS